MDLRFPIPGQQGHGGRIIHFERRIKMLIELTDEKLMQCDGGKTPYQLTVEALRKWLELMNSRR